MSKLTLPQKEVVQHDGHLLVVAGPGSGKTSTSIARARRILADPGRSLLMVTFTKEAAEEMRKRLVRAFEHAGVRLPPEDRLHVATFHSIALKHLKLHGLRKKVMGPRESGLLYQDAAHTCEVDKEDWVEVQREFETLMYAIDPDRAEVGEIARKVARRYQEMLAKTGQIDLFTAMRDCALRVASGDIAPLRYTDMLVDEGQDTDELQRHWIFAHARAGCTVTIVGDDDQSIYEWRNALGYEGMRSFLDEFRARRIELGDNFRCRSEILSRAATLISRNQERLGKHLVAQRGPGGAIIAFHGGADQHRLLLDLVESLPSKHENVAVLARVNRSLDTLEIALRARGIAYQRIGKSIWDAPAIASFIGLLQTLIEGTPAGLLAAMQCRDISSDTRHEVFDVHKGYVSMILAGELPSLESATATDVAILKEMARDIAYWRRQLRAGSVREVILDVATAMSGWHRAEHARSLVKICGELLGKLRGTLSSRLQVVSRRREADTRLTLMTMHGAKGLEFQTVHIIDANKVEDGSTLLHPEAERRLMYVAITRAKDACVLWFSGTPHPAIAEADLSPKSKFEELQSAVAASG
jgi:DNA helicase II / ATP-dependent DNA helicase PcrA